MRPLVICALLAACSAGPSAPKVATFDVIQGKVKQGEEMIGAPAPSLDGVNWLDNPTSTKGRVVLVRWWTDGCSLCSHSGPAITALKAKYGTRLEVRAIYHNKAAGRPVSDESVLATAKERVGMPPAVGRDPGWKVLKRWWLDAGGRRFTSVTFLLDGEGVVRLIHTGGEFHPGESCTYGDAAACQREYAAIDRAIGVLAAE